MNADPVTNLVDSAGAKPDAYSEHYQTSKVKCFAKIVTGFRR